MPDLDLGPDNYREKRSGRWQPPDDPRVLIFSAALGLAMIVFVYWRREEIHDTGTLIAFVALIAGCTGGAIALLLRRWRL